MCRFLFCRQWSFSTWTLKYDVAQKFLRHSTMAKHLCSWVMFLVIFATPNRENVHANHLAITDLKTGLSASQVVTARQQVVATDTTDTTCWQGVGALVPPPRPMLTRAMPTLQASMLNAHSKEKHMPPKHMSRKSLRQRHPDPARRAPVPPRHPAMGCRLGRNVWQVNVWQELVSSCLITFNRPIPSPHPGRARVASCFAQSQMDIWY